MELDARKATTIVIPAGTSNILCLIRLRSNRQCGILKSQGTSSNANIPPSASSTNDALLRTCHVKKYSLKMNDFISLFVSGRQLRLPGKPKNYVNKSHGSSQADFGVQIWINRVSGFFLKMAVNLTRLVVLFSVFCALTGTAGTLDIGG